MTWGRLRTLLLLPTLALLSLDASAQPETEATQCRILEDEVFRLLGQCLAQRRVPLPEGEHLRDPAITANMAWRRANAMSDCIGEQQQGVDLRPAAEYSCWVAEIAYLRGDVDRGESQWRICSRQPTACRTRHFDQSLANAVRARTIAPDIHAYWQSNPPPARQILPSGRARCIEEGDPRCAPQDEGRE